MRRGRDAASILSRKGYIRTSVVRIVARGVLARKTDIKKNKTENHEVKQQGTDLCPPR